MKPDCTICKDEAICRLPYKSKNGQGCTIFITQEVCDNCEKPSNKFIQCIADKYCPSCATKWAKAEEERLNCGKRK